jgi:UDP-GlcNAc:undecaprenyl-phosphate/decaprenyl-phosphate GlcNAc-1-phosphate transferase
MLELLSPFLTAFILTIFATPVTIKIANYFKLVDDPTKNPHPKKIHTRIIPRAGGLAIYIALVLTTLIFLPISKSLIGIFLGISILLTMGLIDDKKIEFSPYLRLFLLFFAASCAVGSGIGINFITNPLHHLPFDLGEMSQIIYQLDSIVIPFDFLGSHRIVILADLLALFWIVSLTQIINWSKGVDGQMPGITTVASLTLGLLSLKLFFQGDPNQLIIAKLSLVVAGASLGFLLFNWHPAKIFPGFSGSTILAFMLAVLSILSGAKLATALLVLAIPTVDFAYTFFRRLLTGHSPVWGDRGHLHHKLLDKGWTQRQISLFYILGSAMFGGVALITESSSKFYLLLLAVVSVFGFILWLNSFGDLSSPPDPDNG